MAKRKRDIQLKVRVTQEERAMIEAKMAQLGTKNMGAFLHVIRPITIERGARVAQAVVNESYEVEREDLYEGQWQNDKQRER